MNPEAQRQEAQAARKRAGRPGRALDSGWRHTDPIDGFCCGRLCAGPHCSPRGYLSAHSAGQLTYTGQLPRAGRCSRGCGHDGRQSRQGPAPRALTLQWGSVHTAQDVHSKQKMAGPGQAAKELPRVPLTSCSDPFKLSLFIDLLRVIKRRGAGVNRGPWTGQWAPSSCPWEPLGPPARHQRPMQDRGEEGTGVHLRRNFHSFQAPSPGCRTPPQAPLCTC